MNKIDLIIDALIVTNSTLWSTKIDEALFVARELKAEIAVNAIEIERLRRDAACELRDQQRIDVTDIVNRAIAYERESCARIAENVKPKSFFITEAKAAAAAIRERDVK